MAGIKGEVTLAELCRRYGVSETTYYKLRDRFIASGVEGLNNSGHTRQVKALQDRVTDLERVLGKKSLEIELLKKNAKTSGEISQDHARTLAAEYADKGLSVSEVARILGVPRQRLYAHKRSLAKPLEPVSSRLTDDAIEAAMRELLADEPRRRHFGYRRWCAVLRRRRNLIVNHKRLLRLLRDLGWTQARIKRGKRIKTERPDQPTAPNQVWAIDMTKFWIEGAGWLHSVAIIDLFDRQIVGHHESRRARAGEWLMALDKALLNRFSRGVRGSGLTLLSDNGSQPTARPFLDALKTCGIKPSFIAVGEPKQNAYIERYFRTLKEEEIWPSIYDTVEEARRAIADFVRY